MSRYLFESFFFLRCNCFYAAARRNVIGPAGGARRNAIGLAGGDWTDDGAPFIGKVCHIITVRHVVILYILSSDEDQGVLQLAVDRAGGKQTF